MDRRQELERIIYLNQQAIEMLRGETEVAEDQIHNCRVDIVKAKRELWKLDETTDSLAEKMEKWAA